ncbi:MAG TPA: chemotaxis protein CheW [Gemmatimonadales bacterium]|jgi:purine-binding chemotaxis protein CheW|nr:chemotaxis protein CheW [Gemmatimonadales bacterium]
MSEATLVRLLVFRVGNLACAAEVDAVREILPRLPTTRIPGAPPVVAGLVNVRGTLVTVVEGWRALGQPAPPPADEAGGGGAGGTTILLEVAAGGGRKLIGFMVDEVMDMLAVSEATLEERKGLAGVNPTLVRAVGRRGGQIFVVLDVVALLGPILTTHGREQ